MIWLGFMAYHINYYCLFNTKSSLYIYIKNMWFCFVLWHIVLIVLTISVYLMPNPLYVYIKYIWFGLVEFYGITAIVGILIPNPLYTYILDIYDLVWLGFMGISHRGLFMPDLFLYPYLPTLRTGSDTMSIFKRSLTGLNSELLKNTVCPTI